MNRQYLKPSPEPPAIRDAMAKASERQNKDLPVFDFSSGNIGRLVDEYDVFNDFSLSVGSVPEGFEGAARAIIRGLKKAFVDSPTGLAYSPTGGTESQKRTVLDYFRKVHEVPLKDGETDQVIVTAGGQQAMATALRSISPETKVIAPRWDYGPVMGIASEEPWEFVKLPSVNGGGFSLDDLHSEALEGSVFYTSMPNNPSGYVSADRLYEAAEIMEERNGALIWDAPYLFTMFELTEQGAQFDSDFLEGEIDQFRGVARDHSEHMCILSSISKTCLAAGLRFGFATAPEEWIQNMNGIIGRENLSSPTPSFIIGDEILRTFIDDGITVHEWASELLASRVNYLLERNVPLILPRNHKFGALYVLMETDEMGSKVTARLGDQGVITVPAKPFYGKDTQAVRLSLVSVPFVKGDYLWKENVDNLTKIID